MVEKDVGARRGRKTLVSLIYISATVYAHAYGWGGDRNIQSIKAQMVMINGFNSFLCFHPLPPIFYIRIFSPSHTQDLRIPLAASSHIQNNDFRFSVLNIAVQRLAMLLRLRSRELSSTQRSQISSLRSSSQTAQLSRNFHNSSRQTLKIEAEILAEILRTSTIFANRVVRIVSA